MRVCLPMLGQSLVEIPHTLWPKKQNIKQQKQYCNKYSKDFKKLHIKKKTTLTNKNFFQRLKKVSKYSEILLLSSSYNLCFRDNVLKS